MKVSVFGLGKLGAPMLATFAEKGLEVIGYDVSEKAVSEINSGFSSIVETDLQEFLDRNKERYSATNSVEEAVHNSEASFIIVPTPSGDDDLFINDYVLACVKDIGAALKSKDGYHLVVITSTVVPGATATVIQPALEKFSGKKVGEDIGLCYNPEFIALGTVVRDMLYPDIILIGESDDRAGSMLQDIYEKTTNSDPICHRMNFNEAEIAKIAVNTFVTTKISYANMLADFCDKVGNADVDKVTNAIGDDSRIGRKYLKGGVAYGGPCFPRDNKAFAALGRKLGVNTNLASSTDNINEYQSERLSSFIEVLCDKSAKIAVLGCSYKPKTPIYEESQGIALSRKLSEMGYEGFYSDVGCQPEGPNGFSYESDLRKIIDEAHCLVLMTEHDEYRNIPEIMKNQNASEKVIIDPWRMLSASNLDGNHTYVTPGSSKR